MAIGGNERHGMEIDAERKNSVASAALEAKIDENLKIKEQTELEQIPIRTNITVLWLKKQHRVIRLYEDIRSTMVELQFKLVTKPTSQTKWVTFRCIGSGFTRQETLERAPQLPFPILESVHPAFYKEFIDSISEWIGEEKAKSVFDVNIIPAGSICIKNYLEGQYPCTWRKEIRLLGIGLSQLKNPHYRKALEKLGSQSMRLTFSEFQNKEILWKSEIENLLAISKFEKGVHEDLINKAVSLWDVTQSCPIKSHSQLQPIIKEMGIKQGNITSLMDQRLQPDCTIYEDISIQEYEFSGTLIGLQPDGTIYEDISIQEYEFPGTLIGLWLPEKFIVDCIGYSISRSLTLLKNMLVKKTWLD